MVYHTRSPFTRKPTIYIYDSHPGGVGFSNKIYEIYREVFDRCREIIENCSCTEGCPSCIGPSVREEGNSKNIALKILGGILGDTQSQRKAKSNFYQLPFQT